MRKVAINGLGRIGRLILRHYLTELPDGIQIVACNDLTPLEEIVYLMKYDSVHGRFPADIDINQDQLAAADRNIHYFSVKDPADLPWKSLDVDIVLECTGFFSKRAGASKHIDAGASQVIISAPSKDADLTCVLGVNQQEFSADQHSIVSNGSCTTNALAPVLKVLNDAFGINHAMATTIHAYTATQALVDRSARKRRRGRAAALSLIPTSTGAGQAIPLVLPELEGKVGAVAVRVPVPDGALVDVTALVKEDVSINGVNGAFEKAAQSSMKNVLRCSAEGLVSSDIIGDTYSAIVDVESTMVLNNRVVKVMAWYDNEAAYAKRMLDLALYIASC